MMTPRIIELGHGAGGVKMHDLICDIFGSSFASDVVESPDDSAVLEVEGTRIAFTTDGFVVRPLFFPGGDIGCIAVCGTVNDLAMVGAVPRWLSVAMIIEEGFEESTLLRVAESIGQTAREAGVTVVTGDTKVVERGSTDGIFITTSGIGIIPPGVSLGGNNARPGMSVLVSGTLGDHEIAILNARERLVDSKELSSDCGPINHMVASMLESCPGIACLRDPTRGGLATTLNEIASQSGVEIEIWEEYLPVRKSVAGICDLLGLDPLYLANEGKLIAIVKDSESKKLLSVMRQHTMGREAKIIGKVVDRSPGTVVLITSLGGKRVLDMLSGRPIPRIC
jgi:hydrogenase expression/formation protein HypE